MRLWNKMRRNISGMRVTRSDLLLKKITVVTMQWMDWWPVRRCNSPGGGDRTFNQMSEGFMRYMERERRVLDDLGRCDIELKRGKLRYCQHKDDEPSYKCIENEASVRCPNGNLSREFNMQVWPLEKKIQKEIWTWEASRYKWLIFLMTRLLSEKNTKCRTYPWTMPTFRG